ncbi:MAG: diaminobutyrate acetyltransferase [Burkholderiales bacterium]
MSAAQVLPKSSTRSEHGPPVGFSLVQPAPGHAAEIRDLIKACKPLDVNSTYAYLLLCHHFAETCVIALEGERIVGFISAYIPPSATDTLFVWQVAVHETARGQKLGGAMLTHLLARSVSRNVRYLETTVSPSNIPSSRLFERFARNLGADCVKTPLFEREDFGAEAHEEEVLYRIGPFEA